MPQSYPAKDKNLSASFNSLVVIADYNP